MSSDEHAKKTRSILSKILNAEDRKYEIMKTLFDKMGDQASQEERNRFKQHDNSQLKAVIQSLSGEPYDLEKLLMKQEVEVEMMEMSIKLAFNSDEDN